MTMCQFLHIVVALVLVNKVVSVCDIGWTPASDVSNNVARCYRGIANSIAYTYDTAATACNNQRQGSYLASPSTYAEYEFIRLTVMPSISPAVQATDNVLIGFRLKTVSGAIVWTSAGPDQGENYLIRNDRDHFFPNEPKPSDDCAVIPGSGIFEGNMVRGTSCASPPATFALCEYVDPLDSNPPSSRLVSSQATASNNLDSQLASLNNVTVNMTLLNSTVSNAFLQTRNGIMTAQANTITNITNSGAVFRAKINDALSTATVAASAQVQSYVQGTLVGASNVNRDDLEATLHLAIANIVFASVNTMLALSLLAAAFGVWNIVSKAWRGPRLPLGPPPPPPPPMYGYS